MDTDRELNDRRVDDALRDLFHEAGHRSPQEGFEQRILNRLAVMPQSLASTDGPLIPLMGWLVGGCFVVALVVVALVMPAGRNSPISEFLQRLPHIDPSMDWRSPWMIALSAAIALLFAMDHLLQRAAARRTLKH